jgi:hypothetical protein
MEFFNRKEEVLDVELTQYGKYLLSIGEFKPVHYAFYDDDVIYDTQYQGDPPREDDTGIAGPTENQKDSEDRIKETPRIKVQHNFKTVEKTGTQIADDVFYELPDTSGGAPEGSVQIAGLGPNPGGNGGNAVVGSGNDYFGGSGAGVVPKVVYGNVLRYKFPYPKNLKDEMFGYALPLGTSKYNSVYAPAFQANFIKGQLVDGKSIYYDSGSFGIKRIPQVEMEVTFQTSIEQKKSVTNSAFNIEDATTYTDNQPTVTIGLDGPAGNPAISRVFEDGTFIKVVEDYVLLDLQELNSVVSKEGFELEVFEVENPDSSSENLKRLKFTNFGNENYVSPLVDLNAVGQGAKVSNPNQVEYYFSVTLDKEIEQILITQGYNQNLGSTIMEPCEDNVDTEI